MYKIIFLIINLFYFLVNAQEDGSLYDGLSQSAPYHSIYKEINKNCYPYCKIEFPTSYDINLSTKIIESLQKFDTSYYIWEPNEYIEKGEEVLSTNSQFHISTSAYNSLSKGLGDFNGDGIEDAVLVGHIQKNELVLVALSSKTENNSCNYKIIPVFSRYYLQKYHIPNDYNTFISHNQYYNGPTMFVKIYKKGECFKLGLWSDMAKDHSFCLKNDSFSILFIDKATIVNPIKKYLFPWGMKFNIIDDEGNIKEEYTNKDTFENYHYYESTQKYQ